MTYTEWFSLIQENTDLKTEHFWGYLSGSWNIKKLCSSGNGKNEEINFGSKVLEMQFIVLGFPPSIKKTVLQDSSSPVDPGLIENVLLL